MRFLIVKNKMWEQINLKRIVSLEILKGKPHNQSIELQSEEIW